MSGSGMDMFVMLYRWRLKPGHEDAFAAAWSEATRALLQRGSLGSRLHLGSDGLWYAYAQWPSAEARAAAFAAGDGDSGPVACMRAAVEESLPEIALRPIADYLLHAGNE